MTQAPVVAAAVFDRWGVLAVMTLLGLAFVTGGSSSGNSTGEVASQLLALPLVVWTSLQLIREPNAPLRLAALAVACLVIATVAIQLLPLPAQVWRAIPVRDALAIDLQVGGVESVRARWSLSPLATERALWSILPALAVFLGALAVPERAHRRLLEAVMLLAAVSLALGVVQLGLPQDSALNLFPQWVPALNGIFANPNHQAMALAVSSVMAVTLALSNHTPGHVPRALRRRRKAWLVLAAAMLMAIPGTGSRAAFLLALVGLAAVPLALSAQFEQLTMALRRRRSVAVLIMLIGSACLLASLSWVRLDAGDGIRWSLASSTVAMGWAHFPLGAGTGTFVQWFDQAAPEAMVQWEYFNHAHNEIVQWWFEAGVLGMLSMLGVIAILVACYPSKQRATEPDRDRGIAVAAWLGCVLLLSHAWFEYLLRTQGLMTVAALLAGIVVARRVEEHHNPPEADAGLTPGISTPGILAADESILQG